MKQCPARQLIALPKLPPMGRFIRADEVIAPMAFLLWADAGAITWPQAVIRGGSSL